MQDVVVGVDLGGTRTKFGLVSKAGKILAYNTIPTNSSIPYQHFFERLYQKIQNLENSCDTMVEVKGIGIGAPTGNTYTGNIENASNLEWSGTIPVVKVLQNYSKLPVVLINDADASASGEMRYGRARGMENFISITLGTGLGCGIVANGELVTGQKGHAGEIGHSTVYYNGRLCGCGRQGCLEAYVSAPGLIHTMQELIAETSIESGLRDIRNKHLDAEKITEAARDGDQLAIKALENTGEILGLKLADLVAALNPEAIIVSGGLARAGALLLDPARASMEDHLLDIFKNEISILSSGLSTTNSAISATNAAILGAGTSIWNSLEDKKELKVK